MLTELSPKPRFEILVVARLTGISSEDAAVDMAHCAALEAQAENLSRHDGAGLT